MSSANWKPWWEKVADFDTPHEREEFMRGIAGFRPSNRTAHLLGLVAGYYGVRALTKKAATYSQLKGEKNK
jgi:hypothetical protein